jgi:hypothetical protein
MTNGQKMKLQEIIKLLDDWDKNKHISHTKYMKLGKVSASRETCSHKCLPKKEEIFQINNQTFH